jgi:hypothetical protein
LPPVCARGRQCSRDQCPLTLDIDAETTDGFPKDVESVVRDNAASLRISDFGFGGDGL